MIKSLAHICDCGERIKFEIDALRQGFEKIYQAPACDVDFIHAHRADGRTERILSEDTALVSEFRSLLGVYYKFGCVFVTDTKRLLTFNEAEFKDEVRRFIRKYARGHFDSEAQDALVNGYYKKFLKIKNFQRS